jgi:hypothetical protein
MCAKLLLAKKKDSINKNYFIILNFTNQGLEEVIAGNFQMIHRVV